MERWEMQIAIHTPDYWVRNSRDGAISLVLINLSGGSGASSSLRTTILSYKSPKEGKYQRILEVIEHSDVGWVNNMYANRHLRGAGPSKWALKVVQLSSFSQPLMSRKTIAPGKDVSLPEKILWRGENYSVRWIKLQANWKATGKTRWAEVQFGHLSKKYLGEGDALVTDRVKWASPVQDSVINMALCERQVH